MKRFRKKVKARIMETEAAKEFQTTEQFKQMEQQRKEFQEFKSNLREGLDTT